MVRSWTWESIQETWGHTGDGTTRYQQGERRRPILSTESPGAAGALIRQFPDSSVLGSTQAPCQSPDSVVPDTAQILALGSVRAVRSSLVVGLRVLSTFGPVASWCRGTSQDMSWRESSQRCTCASCGQRESNLPKAARVPLSNLLCPGTLVAQVWFPVSPLNRC